MSIRPVRCFSRSGFFSMYGRNFPCPASASAMPKKGGAFPDSFGLPTPKANVWKYLELFAQRVRQAFGSWTSLLVIITTALGKPV